MQIKDSFQVNRKKEVPKSVAAQWREHLASANTKTSVTTKQDTASVASQWRDYLSQPKMVPSIMPNIKAPELERKQFTVAPRVTDFDVQERMKQEKATADKRMRELEKQQKTMSSSNPMAYKAVADEKKQLLNTLPTVEGTRKKLFGEQAKTMLSQNPQDENAWIQYAANTLDAQSLQKFQTDPAFKQATQASLLGEIQFEQRVSQAKAEIDKRWPVDSPVKTIASSLSDWWLGTKAAVNTLDGLAGGNTYNARQIELGRTVSDEQIRQGSAAGDAKLLKGAQQYEQIGINRTALVGEDAVKGFLYDFTSFVPDMAVTMALAVATGGTGNVAQMGMKEIGEAFLKKETRKAAVAALGKKMLVSPETIPLGAKIFAQSYQGNRADGMDEGKAFFVAFINAYGQSVLEGGGVNEAVKTGGLDKAIDFLKASLGEGFEEVKQNWWEGAVNKLIGGKDVAWYSDDPNRESVVNPHQDVYSAGLGFAGGAAGASFKAPGIAARYIEEKTSPKMSLDPAAKINQFKDETVKYEEDKAKYEAALKNKEQSQKAYDKRLKQFEIDTEADYRNEYYTQTELMDAAEKIADELVAFEKQSLEAEMLAKVDENMDKWQIFDDQIAATDKSTILDAVTGGYASDHIMDRVMQEAYKAKPVNEALKGVEIETPAAPEDVKLEAPKEPDAPDMSFTVDTSKMAPSIVKRMEADLAAAEEAGTAQQIIDMATEGKTRSEIVKILGIAPRTVRSVMGLKGIPDAKSAAFAQWQKAKTYGNILSEEVAEVQDINHALASEGLIRDEDAQGRLEKVPALRGAHAVPTEDLEVGHLHAQRLGKRLGVDVVFYSGGREAIRGMFSSTNKDTLFINVEEANEGKITMDIIGHEFLHSLGANHKDLYATLRGVVGDSLTPEKIKAQLAKYKDDPEYQRRLADDQELLIEEMLAEEAGSLFTDQKFWQNVYDRDASAAQKLIRLMRSLINRVLGGDKKSSGNLGVMTEAQVKQFQMQFEEAVAAVMERSDADAKQKASDVFEENMIISEGTAQPVYSVGTLLDSDLGAIKDGLIGAGFSRKTAEKYLNDLDSLAAKILSNPELYDYESSHAFAPVKSKADKLYVVSLDFSTLCKKRYALQAALNDIQSGRGAALTPAEIMHVREALKNAGVEVSCGLCYVDSARLKTSDAINELIADWEKGITRKLQLSREKMSPETKEKISAIAKGKPRTKLSKKELADIQAIRETEWAPLTEEDFDMINAVDPRLLLTSDGQTEMAEEHPEIYKLAMQYVREKSHAKSVEGRSAYAPGMLQKAEKLTKGAIDRLNQNAGMRWQSWSDFEVPHLIDAMQAIGDMAQMKLKGHMYTKVSDAVRAMGRTGMMINMSLIPGGPTGFAADGSLLFDSIEGMDYEEVKAFRNQFPNTAGSIAVGVNDEHILTLMATEHIDFIIPYHISGLSKNLRSIAKGGLAEWLDYTAVQNEKGDGKSPLLLDWWDYAKTGEENVLNYLNLCRERGLRPKFFSNSKHTNFLISPRAEKAFEAGKDIKLSDVRPGSWKLLIDRKMFNGKKPIIQEAVKPIFDNEVNQAIMDNYQGGHRGALPKESADKVAKVVKQFLEKKGNATPLQSTRALKSAEKYSIRMDALEEAFKDSKIRNEDGSLKQVYHGTGADFTVFDSAMNGSYTGAKSAKLGFFFTDHPGIADTYRTGEYDRTALDAFLNNMSDENLEYFAEELGHVDYDWDGNFNREYTLDNLKAYTQEINKSEGIDDFKDFVRKVNSSSLLYDFDPEGWKAVEASLKKGYGKRMELYLNITKPYTVEKADLFEDDFYTNNITKAKESGYDGVIFKNVSDAITAFDEKNPPVGDVYVAFSPTQVKQELGDEAVNIMNPDIRYSVRGDYGMQHHISYYKDETAKADALATTSAGDAGFMPADVYQHPEWYFDMRDPATKQSWAAVHKIKGKPDAEVKIYRGVPAFVNEINEGDWVSLSPLYAKGETREGGKVISKTVYADEIVWDGNSINEFAHFSRDEQKRIEDPDEIKYAIAQPTIDISMDVKDVPPDIKHGFGRAYQRMVDRNLPLSRLDDTVKMRVSNTALVSGTVERIFHHALVDMQGNEVGQSLQEALKDFADNKDFWIYKAQQHNIDRAREGKPVDPGMTAEDSEAYVKAAEAAHPEYKAWSETVTSWIDEFMQTWGVASGTVDAEMYENLRAMYKSYFPTQREFTDLEKSGTGGMGRKYVDQANVIKRAKGSDRDITNPVGNIMMMVNKVVRTARYNEVGQAMLDNLRANPKATYGEEISPNIGMFQSKKLDNIVTVWEGGQPTYIQINDKDLLDALHGLPKIINNAPAVRKFTGLFKGLITQYNPFFALRNIFRDIPTAYVYGSQNNPLFFASNLVKAGYQYATESGGAALYRNLGGAGAGMFSASEAAQYAKLLQPSAASKLKLPLRVIEWFNNLTEQSPRISEFNYVLEKTGSVEQALYAANNVTVNFSRGGDISKQMEPFVPYLNASIQGLDKFVQSFRFDKDPKGAALRMVKGGIAVTIPQIASYLICMGDDDEAYKALSQRTKDSSYVFPKGDGTYWKIPKSREIGVLFGSLFERALTGNFKGFAGTVATNFTPVDPFTSNIASAFVYNLPANKDFAGRTIVPQSLQGYSPRNQYDDNTSEIAKALGKMTDLSPKQIDYIIRSYTGVVGQLLLPATTKRAGAGTAVERLTTGAFTADPAFSSQVVSDFYERLDNLEKAKNDYNKDNAVPVKQTTEQERIYSAMSRVSSEVTRATKYINANLKANDPKIRQIRNAINKQLARALKAESFVDIRTTESDLAAELYRFGVR